MRGARCRRAPTQLPLHVLIEIARRAVHRAFDIAAHPRVAVAQLRPDGFRLGARRRDSGRRHGHRRASSRIRWWCAPSSRSRPPAMRMARCPRTASSPNSSDTDALRRRGAAGRRASSATRGCGASIRTRSGRSSRPSRPTRDEIDIAINNHQLLRRPADWAPISHRRQAARPGQLPLLLAGAGAGAPDRPAAAAGSAGLVRRPASHETHGDNSCMKTLLAIAADRRRPALALAQTTRRKPAAKPAPSRRPSRSSRSSAPTRAARPSRKPRRSTTTRHQAHRRRPRSRQEGLHRRHPVRTRRHACTITPIKREGFFIVRTGVHRFRMHPVESRTGAIRLEDPERGAMWLQLGNKSMLMSQKLGQRLADECQSPAAGSPCAEDAEDEPAARASSSRCRRAAVHQPAAGLRQRAAPARREHRSLQT